MNLESSHLAALAAAAALAVLAAYSLGRRSGPRPAPQPARTPTGSNLELDPMALRTQRLQRELAEASRKQQSLIELLVNLPETVNKLGAARSTEELCRVSARALMEYSRAARIGLFMFDAVRQRFSPAVLAGVVRSEQDLSFVPGQGRLGTLSQWVGVRSGRELDPSVAAVCLADSLFRADLCVAMRRHESSYGFAALDGVADDEPLTRRVLQMIADVHAVSAEGVAALDHERLKADLDQLTGLYNRRHLDRRLPDELERARSYGMALGVFLFDVDNFKHYNDHNGHPAGDACLQAVAAIARQVTRGSDVVCRYGGEEFLVILLGAETTQAWHHAERIRQAIAAAPIAHGAAQPLGCVSISGGVASFPADAQDPAALIKLVDAALYRAKEAGRNRVLLAQAGWFATGSPPGAG